MINTGNYKNILKDFSEVDLSSYEVVFSKKQVSGKIIGFNVEVTLPQIKKKPCALFKLFRKIFYFIFQNDHSLSIAHQIEHFITDATRMLPINKSESLDLINGISKVASRILGDLKKANRNYASEIDQIEQQIKKKTANTESNYLEQIKLECKYKELSSHGSLNFDDIFNSKEHEEINSSLFDHSYVDELISTIERYNDSYKIDNLSFNERIKYLHPDLHSELIENKLITKKDLFDFIQFLLNLNKNKNFGNHHNIDERLSEKNTEVLRERIFAIMNILNSKRNEKGFKEYYAKVISQICRALESDTEGAVRNIENIFRKLYLLEVPKGESTINRVKCFLQLIREDISHKASLMSPDDDNRNSTTLKFLEKYYTPETILYNMWEIINDPFDSSIPKNLFTEWVEENYSIEKRDGLLDHKKNYKIEVVSKFLQDLNIIHPVDNCRRHQSIYVVFSINHRF